MLSNYAVESDNPAEMPICSGIKCQENIVKFDKLQMQNFFGPKLNFDKKNSVSTCSKIKYRAISAWICVLTRHWLCLTAVISSCKKVPSIMQVLRWLKLFTYWNTYLLFTLKYYSVNQIESTFICSKLNQKLNEIDSGTSVTQFVDLLIDKIKVNTFLFFFK